MKIQTLFIVACFVSAANTAWTQNVKDEIQLIQTMWGMEKRDAVRQAMHLSDTDAALFWPLYDEYEIERRKLGSERLLIINDYAIQYATLTDEAADGMAARIFKNDMAYDKLRKSYYGKFKKKFGALKAAKFMQIESYIQTAVLSAIQSELPFIGEIKVTSFPTRK